MRCATLPHSRSHKVACPIITRYNAVVPGWVDTPTKCVPKVRPSLQERTFGTHPGGEVPFPAQLPLYRVMISCTHFGVLQALLRSATTSLPHAAYAAPPPRSKRCLRSATTSFQALLCSATHWPHWPYWPYHPHRAAANPGAAQRPPRDASIARLTPRAEPMTRGKHFRYPARGCSRA